MNLSVFPDFCMAVAINSRAADKMKSIYRSNPSRYSSAAIASNDFNHSFFHSGRIKHAQIARHMLGIIESNDVSSTLTIIHAGWSGLIKALDKGERSFERLCAASMSNHPSNIKDVSALELTLIPSVVYIALQVKNIDIQPSGHMWTGFCNWIVAREREKNPERKREPDFFQKRRTLIESDVFDLIASDKNELDDPNLRPFNVIESFLRFDLELYTMGMELDRKELDLINAYAPDNTIASLAARHFLLLKAIRDDAKWCTKSYLQKQEQDLVESQKEVQGLKEQLKRSAEKIAFLSSNNELVTRKLTVAEANLADLDADRQELGALRSTLYSLSSPYEPNSAIEARILPDKIISIGGPDGWRKTMSDRLPSIRFYSPDVSIPDEVIRTANEVWFYTDYIGHSQFYHAVNLAKGNGTAIKYWPGSNVERCMAAVTAPQ